METSERDRQPTCAARHALLPGSALPNPFYQQRADKMQDSTPEQTIARQAAGIEQLKGQIKNMYCKARKVVYVVGETWFCNGENDPIYEETYFFTKEAANGYIKKAVAEDERAGNIRRSYDKEGLCFTEGPHL